MDTIRALPRVFTHQHDGPARRFGSDGRTVEKLEIFFVYLQAESEEVVLHRERSAGTSPEFDNLFAAATLMQTFFVVRTPQFLHFLGTATFAQALFLVVTGGDSLGHYRALRSEGEDD